MNSDVVALVSFAVTASAAFIFWRLLKPGLDDLRRASPFYRVMLVGLASPAILLGVALPLTYVGITGVPTAAAGAMLGLEFGVHSTRRSIAGTAASSIERIVLWRSFGDPSADRAAARSISS